MIRRLIHLNILVNTIKNRLIEISDYDLYQSEKHKLKNYEKELNSIMFQFKEE